MKKVLSLLVVLCMMLSFVPCVQAADYALAINKNVALMVGNTNAIAHNQIMTIPQAPVEQDGHMLAPINFVAAAFNGEVHVDGNLVTINLGNEIKAQLLIDSKLAVVNGRVYSSPVATTRMNYQVMVPVEFMAETVLGKYVYYDANNKMAVITQRKCLSSRDSEALTTIATALNTGDLPAIVIKAPVVEVTTSLGGAAAETGKLTFVSVSADQEPEPDNNGQCMIDGSTATRWASQGAGSAILDLGSAKPVTHIKVAVWKPNERNTNYSIEVSDNGTSYSKIFDGSSSGSTYDSYDVNQTIRYVRINTNGTSVGEWASILELEAWNGTATVTTTTGPAVAGSVVAAPSGTKVNLTSSMVTVSQAPEAENGAPNLVDNNVYTVWASQGEASATINLGSGMTVSTVGVAMKMYDDDRTIPYDIAISADGSNYTQVWSGSSDPQTDTMKYVSVGSAAKFVKVTVHGNTVSGWSSVGEINVHSTGAAAVTTTTTTTTTTPSTTTTTTANGTKLSLTASMLTASQTPEAENHAGNLVDGDKYTVWASQGDADVVIDLGSAKTVSAVGVAMKMYDDTRTIPYEIALSTDGVTYTTIFSGDSAPQTDTTAYATTNTSARYVKVTAHGNTVSGWNSIGEIEVYTK